MNSKHPDISLILACYNEGSALLSSLEKIIEILDDTKYLWEIICIDDKSKDNTARVLKEFSQNKKNVKVFFHQQNLGRGGTVKEGIKYSKGRIVGYIDVDLEISPIYIPEFIREVNKGMDIVVGTRIYRELSTSPVRWLTSKAYILLVKNILKINFQDTEAGYKFFNKEKIIPILNKTRNLKWFFDTEIMVLGHWSKLKVKEIPVLFLRRTDKKSTVRLFYDSFDYLKTLLKYKKDHKKYIR